MSPEEWMAKRGAAAPAASAPMSPEQWMASRGKALPPSAPSGPAQIPGAFSGDAPPQPQRAPDRSFMDRLLGGGEAALSAVTSIPGAIAGPVVGAAQDVLSGRMPGPGTPGDQTATRLMQTGYQPRTEAGREALEGFGSAMEALKIPIQPMTAPVLTAGMAGAGRAAGAAGKVAQKVAPVVEAAAGKAAEPVAAAAKKVTAPVTRVAGNLTGSNLKAAQGEFKAKFGDLPERATQAAERLRTKGEEAKLKAGERLVEARRREIEMASTSAEADKAHTAAVGAAKRQHEEAQAKLRTTQTRAREDLDRAMRQQVEQVRLSGGKAAETLLPQTFGTPKNEHEIGALLKERLAGAEKSAYEARGKASTQSYDAAKAAADQMEGAGQTFAASTSGQKLLIELEAMKKPGPAGTRRLTDQQQAAIDRLIGSVAGEGEAAQPGGYQLLVDQLRLLRKVDERSAPTEGYAALGKKFANDLSEKLSEALYEWNPAYKQADESYRAASTNIDELFGVEGMRSPLRGEEFDFRRKAASPSEYGPAMFKDAQSVENLRRVAGDQFVTENAREWAAHKLQDAKSSEAVDTWARKNQSWLKASGIEGDVHAYADKLRQAEQQAEAKAAQIDRTRIEQLRKVEEQHEDILRRARYEHEDKLAEMQAARDRVAAREKQRMGTLQAAGKRAATGLEKVGESSISQAESMSKLSRDVDAWMKYTSPQNLGRSFETQIMPKLIDSGLLGEAEIKDLAQQVRAIDTTYQGTTKARRIAGVLTGAIGAGWLVRPF